MLCCVDRTPAETKPQIFATRPSDDDRLANLESSFSSIQWPLSLSLTLHLPLTNHYNNLCSLRFDHTLVEKDIRIVVDDECFELQDRTCIRAQERERERPVLLVWTGCRNVGTLSGVDALVNTPKQCYSRAFVHSGPRSGTHSHRLIRIRHRRLSFGGNS